MYGHNNYILYLKGFVNYKEFAIVKQREPPVLLA